MSPRAAGLLRVSILPLLFAARVGSASVPGLCVGSWSDPRPPVVDLHAAASTGRGFVAVGWGSEVLTSDDGRSWTGHPLGANELLEGVASNGSELLAVGPQGRLLRSADGSSWEPLPPPTSENLFAIAWGGGTWVLLGGSQAGAGPDTWHAVILASHDGRHWSEVKRFSNGWLGSILWTGSRFVAAGAPGSSSRAPTGPAGASRRPASPNR